MPSAPQIHILTFDLEEWFYIYSNQNQFNAETYWQNSPLRAEAIIQQLLSLLAEKGSKATFFCMGRFARQFPKLIQQIHEAGHEIGAHSNLHQYASQQSLSAFRLDLQQNLACLEELIGEKVKSYRTPAYSIDTLQPAYQAILNDMGLIFDSSMKAGSYSHFGKVPNQPFTLPVPSKMTCFPVSTFKRLSRWPYAGSGFFRVMPDVLVERQLNKPGYHMLYFHARDFDPAMFQLPTKFLDRMKYGVGASKSMSRLAKLLNQHKMYSIEAATKLPQFNDLMLNLPKNV